MQGYQRELIRSTCPPATRFKEGYKPSKSSTGILSSDNFLAGLLVDKSP